MTDIELLERIKAQEELYKMGYIKEICARCHGTGWILGPRTGDEQCWVCEGKGYFWLAPLIR